MWFFSSCSRGAKSTAIRSSVYFRFSTDWLVFISRRVPRQGNCARELISARSFRAKFNAAFLQFCRALSIKGARFFILPASNKSPSLTRRAVFENLVGSCSENSQKRNLIVRQIIFLSSFNDIILYLNSTEFQYCQYFSIILKLFSLVFQIIR